MTTVLGLSRETGCDITLREEHKIEENGCRRNTERWSVFG